jgi:hypothetical protein
MADDRKIILQLEIDAQKGIQNIVSVKDRIAALKKEQAALNVETQEGKATFEAYNAQIKALTKEQKSLELAVEKTAAGFEYEAGSIAANRAELSKLTAEYKNLANPSKEQTARIKELSDRLKEQESAIGNTSRNVGNYKEALTGIQTQLGAFGPEVQRLTQGFNGVTQGLKFASAGFKTLGGAIITSGIGILVVLLAQLISYFKQTDDGATKLEGALGAIGAVTKEISGFVAELGGRLTDILTGVESFDSALEDLGETILNNIINRFTSFLVLGDAIGELFKGNFKEAAKTGFDALIQFQTGITNSSDKLSAYADQLAAAAKQAFEYAIRIDAINDAQRDLDVTNAKSNQIVQQLIINAKNKSLTDQERIDLLLRANKIEESSVQKQQSLDKQRLALIIERNEREKSAINQKLERDIKEAKSEEKKIQLRQKALSINDELAQEQADLEKKIIDAETSFISLREKNQNKISALEEQIAADRQKAYEAYVKQLQEINQAELNLENQRQARVVSNLDYEISKIKDNDAQKILLMRLRFEEEKALQKQIADERLAQLTTESLQENANQEKIALEKLAVEEQSKQTLLELERKYQDDITAVNEAGEKKRTEDIKKEQEARKREQDKQYNDIKKGINDIAQFALTINEASLNTQILKNESARKKELASVGNDKKKQDEINKKYDKKEADARRKSAKDALDIQSIQAAAGAALAVVQALSSSPPPASYVFAAISTALGVAQVLKLQAEKSKLAKGGLIHIGGNLHSAGGTTFTGTDGTVFEAERGEVLAVVNRHDSKTLGHLSAINSVHGNPFFSAQNRGSVKRNHFADGGLVARVNSGGVQETQQQINAMKDTIQSLQIVVGVRDITSGIAKRAEVVDRANVTK